MSDANRDATSGPVIRVICGPTAAGKTAVAMRLAESTPVTIISADSRQVYRGFDIGTAKPSHEELARVPHVGVDVAEPLDRFSAWQWAALAREGIAKALAEDRTPLIVGGTGFYLRALVQPLAELPPLDRNRRDAFSQWLDRQPRELWRRWCERLDPAKASLGPVQWRRAIETAILSGTRLSDLHADQSGNSELRVRYLVVDPGAVLAQRIAQRVSAMLNAGWADEVAGLSRSVPLNAPAWQATGYSEVLSFVQGSIAQEEMITRVVVRTRQYAKRQRTWFRHQLDETSVTRVSPGAADFVDQVNRWWNAYEEEIV